MEEIICLGHILGKCKHCLSDDFNKQCNGYIPVKVWVLKVKENEDERK